MTAENVQAEPTRVARQVRVTSLVASKTKTGAVQIDFIQDDTAIATAQVEPGDARDIALSLFGAAASSEEDADLLAYLTGALHLELPRAASVLEAFRQHRIARAEERANAMIDGRRRT